VRFIDAFVDGLNLAAAGFKRVTPKVTGRPGYAPGDLLKLYIYGYLNRVRSSRRLEAECQFPRISILIETDTHPWWLLSSFGKENILRHSGSIFSRRKERQNKVFIGKFTFIIVSNEQYLSICICFFNMKNINVTPCF
jgi:hypothetical protein